MQIDAGREQRNSHPQIITGCMASAGGRVLLCRRATAPRIGSWTPPAGFMEAGESIEQAMRREVREETGAELGAVSLYALFDVAHMGELYVIFRGELQTPNVRTGCEMSDVRLFDPVDIPWGQLFYPGIESLLRCYLQELRTGKFPIHVGSSDEYGRIAEFESGNPFRNSAVTMNRMVGRRWRVPSARVV